LGRQLELQSKPKTALSGVYQDDGIVFCNGLGGWMETGWVLRGIKKLRQRIGHPELNPRGPLQ
jgi:hypothetical protein